MKYIFSLLPVVFALVSLGAGSSLAAVPSSSEPQSTLFGIQSIDTMKDSRDLAGSEAALPAYRILVDKETALVKASGATHIAIGTPYDEQFLPVMRLWVDSARAQGLSVWFRGNFSGWEGWFGYPRMEAYQHTDKIVSFIAYHPDLFAAGDIFSSCPECENGAAGDPRATHDVSGYRHFLIDEYSKARGAFTEMDKDVLVINSMNFDVASLVMDKPTTRAMGGIVAIDDYVKSPAILAQHIESLKSGSGGRIVIGEFGAPIPDLNGSMTGSEQSAFVRNLLDVLYEKREDIDGINYWSLHNGSTALTEEDLQARPVLETIGDYYGAYPVSGTVKNDIGMPLSGIHMRVFEHDAGATDSGGNYRIFLPRSVDTFFALDPNGYYGEAALTASSSDKTAHSIVLVPHKEGIWYKFTKYILGFF